MKSAQFELESASGIVPDDGQQFAVARQFHATPTSVE
jgi:hypothetical protein